MYDTNERILEKLAETGQEAFSAGMVKKAMDKVEEEDLEIQYQEWLKLEEAEANEREQWRADEITLDRIERQQYEATHPVTWAQAVQGLEDIPPREHSGEMEMER